MRSWRRRSIARLRATVISQAPTGELGEMDTWGHFG
jgi:hypothetical protein